MGGRWSSLNSSEIIIPHLQELYNLDPYLKYYENDIKKRYALFKDQIDRIEMGDNSIDDFSKSYQNFGIHINLDNTVTVKEWVPAADQVYLTGEFCNWEKFKHPFEKLEFGKWQLHLDANSDGSCTLEHLSEVKIIIKSKGQLIERLSPWAVYVNQSSESNESITYKQRIWNPKPENVYKFQYEKPTKPKSLRIYECHVGIATKELRIGTYLEFATNVIPRIVKQGYNAIQLMAIMEHAYYASFGYQVTSFFAVSSRFGTPEELKKLIDIAHKHGVYVLLDIVHSHASKNTLDGLNMFDGTDACFFHSGNRGEHPLWDSRLFNYGEYEVLRFLLSNLRWYIDQYNFDGYRFDGVTSMLYHSRGLGQGFSGHYEEYFNLNVDIEGLVYLMLANYMLHHVYPEIITIAEDVSGMPGMCRPIYEGGIGFDYRLGMAIPDKWIKLLKEVRDEEWNMGDIVWTLTNRRWMEKTVAYAESHDQALVGDKTIAFWLMDKHMYTDMSILNLPNTVIDRGIALHKLITLITHSLGGEAYLNFMGNEFGHPEWLDFPRAGNNNSYHYARRQWNLADDDLLKYKFLNQWNEAVNLLEEKYGWLHSDPGYVSWKHEADKIIVYERASLLFVFNFNPEKSFADYPVGVNKFGMYKVILNSDDSKFGGYNRIDSEVIHSTKLKPFADRLCTLKTYTPSRTAVVYALDGGPDSLENYNHA